MSGSLQLIKSHGQIKCNYDNFVYFQKDVL